MCVLGGWSDGQDEMGKLKELLLFSLGKWANNETGYGRRGIDSISLSLSLSLSRYLHARRHQRRQGEDVTCLLIRHGLSLHLCFYSLSSSFEFGASLLLTTIATEERVTVSIKQRHRLE